MKITPLAVRLLGALPALGQAADPKAPLVLEWTRARNASGAIEETLRLDGEDVTPLRDGERFRVSGSTLEAQLSAQGEGRLVVLRAPRDCPERLFAPVLEALAGRFGIRRETAPGSWDDDVERVPSGVPELLRDLGAEGSPDRDRALRALVDAGPSIAPAAIDAWRTIAEPEVRGRILVLLRALAPGIVLQLLSAGAPELEEIALETLGSPETLVLAIEWEAGEKRAVCFAGAARLAGPLEVERLVHLLVARGKRPRVQIEAPAELPYSEVVAAMDALRRAGIEEVRFGVVARQER